MKFEMLNIDWMKISERIPKPAKPHASSLPHCVLKSLFQGHQTPLKVYRFVNHGAGS
jgi:hypothetical protein